MGVRGASRAQPRSRPTHHHLPESKWVRTHLPRSQQCSIGSRIRKNDLPETHARLTSRKENVDDDDDGDCGWRRSRTATAGIRECECNRHFVTGKDVIDACPAPPFRSRPRAGASCPTSRSQTNRRLGQNRRYFLFSPSPSAAAIACFSHTNPATQPFSCFASKTRATLKQGLGVSCAQFSKIGSRSISADTKVPPNFAKLTLRGQPCWKCGTCCTRICWLPCRGLHKSHKGEQCY